MGFLNMTAMGESPIDPNNGDQADIAIGARLTDVRRQSDLLDYTGELRFTVDVRLTDRFNSFLGSSYPATVTDFQFGFTVSCAATPDTSIGGECALHTTADAITAGMITERQRAIMELDRVQVYDGGADGDADTAGDNTLFMEQGLFLP